METINVEQKKASNSLVHKIYTKDAELNDLIINISLDDDCKNGHQDFSITADCYKAGRQHTDRNYLYGGCAHEEILKVRPDLKIFVNLHLADYTGCPMYTVENGFYHLTRGFNNTKPNDPTFKSEFCEYYRITPAQFDELRTSENELRYALKLDKLGILEQWEKEANKAIAKLEEWTGKKFIVDSRKSQYHGLTDEQKATEEERERTGYYTHEAIAQRREEAKAKYEAEQYSKIEAERDKEIGKIQLEYLAKKAVLDAGLSLKNFIFYSHSCTGSFNWQNSERQITKEEFNAFISSPVSKVDGIEWSMKG